jgi:PAS domain-containing protein
MERSFVTATLDVIPALVIVLDTAGRVVRFNRSCGQLTGLNLAGSAGRPFVEQVLEAEDHHWAAGKVQEAAAGQVSGPHETGWRVAGANPRRVSWTLRPFKGPNEEIQYLIVSGQDEATARRGKLSAGPRAEWWRSQFGLQAVAGGQAHIAQCVHGRNRRVAPRGSHRAAFV